MVFLAEAATAAGLATLSTGRPPIRSQRVILTARDLQLDPLPLAPPPSLADHLEAAVVATEIDVANERVTFHARAYAQHLNVVAERHERRAKADLVAQKDRLARAIHYELACTPTMAARELLRRYLFDAVVLVNRWLTVRDLGDIFALPKSTAHRWALDAVADDAAAREAWDTMGQPLDVAEAA